jgi:hypothetical protein
MRLTRVISTKPLSIHVSLVRLLLFELRGESSAPFHEGRDMAGTSVSKWNTVIYFLGKIRERSKDTHSLGMIKGIDGACPHVASCCCGCGRTEVAPQAPTNPSRVVREAGRQSLCWLELDQIYLRIKQFVQETARDSTSMAVRVLESNQGALSTTTSEAASSDISFASTNS